MKKFIYLLTPVMVTSLLVNCGTAKNSPSSWHLTNPDGSLAIDVALSDKGSLTYSVKKNNQAVVNFSLLGMEFVTNVDGVEKKYDFSKGLTFVSAKSDEKEFSYVCHSGKVNQVTAHYKEKVITTKVDDLLMDVTFRALNDGYGFQYTFRKEDSSASSLIWENEFTEFNLPTDSITYGMDYVPNRTDKGTFYSYEEQYLTRPILDIDYVNKISLPFGYDANGYYSFITESALIGSGYHGSFLQKNDEGILATVEAPASGTDPDYSVTLPFTSPWRVSCVGNYATAVETTIVEDIQGNVQEYIPEGETDFNYDWVEPGLAAWSWYLNQSTQADYNLQRNFIELAKQMKWKYIILDGGWEGNHPFSEQKALIDDAHTAGVKVIVWAETMDKFGNLAKMRRTLDYYKLLGVDGLKVDF